VRRTFVTLDPDPSPAIRETLAAIGYLERTVSGAERLDGLALRYGALYGPGTAMAEEIAVMIRRRRFPQIGAGAGVWSFVHVADPAPVSGWLPHLVAMLGAKPSWHVPTWIGRIAMGEPGVVMMTQPRGLSNAKASGSSAGSRVTRAGAPASARARRRIRTGSRRRCGGDLGRLLARPAPSQARERTGDR
jgi:hypothetical protein